MATLALVKLRAENKYSFFRLGDVKYVAINGSLKSFCKLGLGGGRLRLCQVPKQALFSLAALAPLSRIVAVFHIGVDSRAHLAFFLGWEGVVFQAHLPGFIADALGVPAGIAGAVELCGTASKQ